MDFIRGIDPDYLSVHTAIPRSGTELRTQMIDDGLISQSLESMDQSGSEEAVPSNTLDAETIIALRRKFNLRFHLRPRYLLWTFLCRLRQPLMFLEHLRQGLLLLTRNIKIGS